MGTFLYAPELECLRRKKAELYSFSAALRFLPFEAVFLGAGLARALFEGLAEGERGGPSPPSSSDDKTIGRGMVV